MNLSTGVNSRWDLYFVWGRGQRTTSIKALRLASGEFGEEKKKQKATNPQKNPKTTTKGNTTKLKLFFLLLLLCGFSKRGLRTAREDEGTADGCKVDPTIQSGYTAEDTFFSSAPSSEAAGCIDSICSGK